VIESPALCARYCARAVLGVKVGPSPAWLRRRLESIGQRSINNVVDATNFVLWELGQPLHPFDLARLAGRRLSVREARTGEKVVTLDGVERTLASGMPVIADERGPVALAGIMGGRSSEIGDATTDVLLESAWFDPVAVRRAARALGLRTDASHRFERGADPEAARTALDRAAALIVDVAGGTITDPPIDAGAGAGPARHVRLRPERLPAILGYDPGAGAARRILEALGFAVDAGSVTDWRVRIPSYRRDVEREEDLVEEVARLAGYDAIPAALPVLHADGAGRGAEDRLVRDVRRTLLACGLSEAVNFAMADAGECRLFLPTLDPVGIVNPLHSETTALRTTLLPGLLHNVAHNLNHGLAGCHLFEIGRVFHPGAERPFEGLRAAGVMAGRAPESHWSQGWREADLYDASGALEQLAATLGVLTLRLTSDRIPAGAGVRGLVASIDGVDGGFVGDVAPPILRRFGVDRPVFAFEIDLALLGAARPGDAVYRALPRFPAVRRDLALVVPETVTVDAVDRVLREASPLPIIEVRVFDRFRGKGLPPGTAGVAVQVTFQHPDRTLSAEEVQAAQAAVVAALDGRLGVRLRGGGG
jgi:phenylalanyl-tRNA synthetase beta chain